MATDVRARAALVHGRKIEVVPRFASRSACLAFAMAFASACGEAITTQASTAAEARQRLESGGWWPSAIPEAATAFVEAHDLDTNEQKIMFAIESPACRRAAEALKTSTADLPRVPDLRLEGWPEWLADAGADTLRRRGATAVRAESGTLVLACDEARGYFWR